MVDPNIAPSHQFSPCQNLSPIIILRSSDTPLPQISPSYACATPSPLTLLPSNTLNYHVKIYAYLRRSSNPIPLISIINMGVLLTRPDPPLICESYSITYHPMIQLENI